MGTGRVGPLNQPTDVGVHEVLPALRERHAVRDRLGRALDAEVVVDVAVRKHLAVHGAGGDAPLLGVRVPASGTATQLTPEAPFQSGLWRTTATDMIAVCFRQVDYVVALPCTSLQ